MKIFKNYSVVNYFVILGLAFTLLFFSACGKKETADEIKLPQNNKISHKKISTIVKPVVTISINQQTNKIPAPKIKFYTIKGIVKYEKAAIPAPEIEINCKNPSYKSNNFVIITDDHGNFEISLPKSRINDTVLYVNEPGYAKVKREIDKNSDDYIRIMLRETGFITGQITDENDEPVPGIYCLFVPDNHYKNWKETWSYAVKNENPSDELGYYAISNVASPETFTLFKADGNDDYFLFAESSDKKIKVEPDRETTFNFKMLHNPKIKIKLLDENEIEILKYKLGIIAFKNYESKNVLLNDEAEWYETIIKMENTKDGLSLAAKSDDGKIASTNDIIISAGETYEIVLKIDPDLLPAAKGFAYNYDMTPLTNTYILATSDSKQGVARCDSNGWFEIINLSVKKGTDVQLKILKDMPSDCFTNIIVSENAIKLIYSKPKYITGKVFINNIDTPATNFGIHLFEISHNKRIFHNDKGKFSIFFNSPNRIKPFKLFVDVDGYFTEERIINPTDEKSFNLGNIIIKNDLATVSGNIFDQNYNPLCSDVVLIKNGFKHAAYTYSNEDDGSYEIKVNSKGKYFVKAYGNYKSVKSEQFEINFGDDYYVPDLIIVETNISDVVLSFVYNNGDPVTNIYINSPIDDWTDNHGIIKKKMLQKRYEEINIEIGDKFYFTEPFTIKKDTKEITVKIFPCTEISGTVTLNNIPLDYEYIYFSSKNLHYTCCTDNGKFKLQIKPGKYAVYSYGLQSIVIIDLKESGDNKIEFKTGSAFFDFEFPFTNDWSVRLIRKIENFKVNLLDIFPRYSTKYKLSNIQAGDYIITLSNFDSDNRTNITVETTINAGETKKIKF